MEQLDENLYIADLGNVNTAPEIIFELSSILYKEEAKNRRICLKLGNVDLNQAQLLSIKSLINGIDSTLSVIDTKSAETEKVALSLGIIVANLSDENSLDVEPEMTYKTVEEYKEEINAKINEDTSNINDDAYDEQVVDEIQQETAEEKVEDISSLDDAENNHEDENITLSEVKHDIQKEQAEYQGQSIDVQDELDVIFTSSPAQNTFMEMEASHSEYSDREEIGEIAIPEQEYTREDIELESFPTKYIKQTIRSGQVINYEGNVVIIGDCHPGCEITAFGDITVWGVLGGIAHAGAGGNHKARVRALQMNAIQLRIANCYTRRPDSMHTIYAEKTNTFTPEEARIVNNDIVVFKIND